jgi:hypothetical protein
MYVKTYHDFNKIFDSGIITLPKNIICLGNNKGEIVEYQAEDYPRCRDVIALLRSALLQGSSGKYLLLCTYDGYRERIAFKNRILDEYIPTQGEFDSKIEIDSESGRTPVLHRNKTIMCFNKHINDHTAICIPDPHIVSSRESIYKQRFEIIDHKSFEWHSKKKEFIYRGKFRPGGVKCFFSHNPSLSSPRKHFLVKAQESKYQDLINVGIDHVNVSTQIEFKFLFDIDGNTNTWDSLVWKLYSGSVVLKQESIWKQWYYDKLKAWEHYIPIKNDFSDLDEIIEWCIRNDDKCEKIAANAKNFIIKNFNANSLKNDMDNIINIALK